MDVFNRVLKDIPSTSPSIECQERVRKVLLDFYTYFIQENIQLAKHDWDSELEEKDFHTYFSQSQDKVPYDLFHNVEAFLYQFTGNPLPDITVTSQLKDQSSDEAFANYKEFRAILDDQYCSLIKNMYISCTESHTRKDIVTKDNFAALIDALCDYWEDDLHYCKFL